MLEPINRRIEPGEYHVRLHQPGANCRRATMEVASDTSGEYQSCSENFAWDSDQDEASHLTSTISSFLGSISTAALFHSDSNTVILLVCLNAARVLLAEITNPGRIASSLRSFKGEAILKRIIAIRARWNVPPDEEFGAIIALPIFQSSLGLLRSERRYCSQRNISVLISLLRDEPTVAIVSGRNDTLTIINISTKPNGRPSSYLVFNPQCRAAPDLGGASLRFFRTIEETTLHVYDIIAIHRGVESNAPQHMYAGYILVPLSNTTSSAQEIASQYQANMCLLQATLKLKATRARRLSSRIETIALQNKIEVEIQAEKDACMRRDARLAEIVASKVDLHDAHAITAALLEVQPSLGQVTAKNDANSEEVGKAIGGEEPASTTRESLSSETNPTDSYRSEISTPPTSPETLWSTDANQNVIANAQPEKEGSIRKRLQTEMEEEQASLALALKLLQEDEASEVARIGNFLFEMSLSECPLCGDKCNNSSLVHVERCNHAVCTTCVREGKKVAERGDRKMDEPLFCPVCPEGRPDRGAITQTMDE